MLGGNRDNHMFHLFIADNLKQARSAGSLSSVDLTITDNGARNLRIQMNGRDVDPAEQTDPLLRRGSNSLVVLLDGVDNPSNWQQWPELQLVEAAVRYE